MSYKIKTSDNFVRELKKLSKKYVSLKQELTEQAKAVGRESLLAYWHFKKV